MTCSERDPDLLLFGLGELPFWQRQRVAYHLRSCPRCRQQQATLATVSGHIADALQPPTGGGGGRGPGATPTAGSGWLGFSPLFLALVLSVLTVTVATIWYVRSHASVHRVLVDEDCRPGLPNDRCR